MINRLLRHIRTVRPRHRILILGTGKEAEEIAKELRERPHLNFELAGVIDLDDDGGEQVLGGYRVVGAASEVLGVAKDLDVATVIVADRDTRGKLDMTELLQCKTQNIRVVDGGAFYETITGRVRLNARASAFVFGDGFFVSSQILSAKRVLDVAIAGVGLLLLSPLFALIAAAIRLDSRGPVFYRQERVGFRGREFRMWKFRSMRVDAEEEASPLWAQPEDHRVTRVGWVLRRFSLDELPQLWNILKGEMSVVGPRPEREHFVRNLCELSPLYQYRTAVRPGLTGWAQIRAPYASSYENSLYKLSFDLFYIKNISIALDLAIIAGTFRVVFFGRPKGPEEFDHAITEIRGLEPTEHESA